MVIEDIFIISDVHSKVGAETRFLCPAIKTEAFITGGVGLISPQLELHTVLEVTNRTLDHSEVQGKKYPEHPKIQVASETQVLPLSAKCDLFSILPPNPPLGLNSSPATISE